jgi:hypothetical protein
MSRSSPQQSLLSLNSLPGFPLSLLHPPLLLRVHAVSQRWIWPNYFLFIIKLLRVNTLLQTELSEFRTDPCLVTECNALRWYLSSDYILSGWLQLMSLTPLTSRVHHFVELYFVLTSTFILTSPRLFRALKSYFSLVLILSLLTHLPLHTRILLYHRLVHWIALWLYQLHCPSCPLCLWITLVTQLLPYFSQLVFIVNHQTFLSPTVCLIALGCLEVHLVVLVVLRESPITWMLNSVI